MLLIFGLKAYDIWAKTWLAGTGKYVCKGKITYTEFRQSQVSLPKVMGNIPNEGMICFAYYVDSHLHTGTLSVEGLSKQFVDKNLQPGQEIDVYYSPRAPHHPFPQHPPGTLYLVRRAVDRWLLVPLAIVNIITMWVWALVQQA